MLKIILGICFLPLPFILFFIEIAAANIKKGMLLGVTLSESQANSEEVVRILKSYRRNLVLWTLFLVLTGIPPLFFHYDSTTSMYFFIWFLFALTLPFVPYAKGNIALKALKEAEGWPTDPIDEKWVWGMFYRDPEDNRFSVEKRDAFGTTINMAKPAAKVMMLFLALTLLAMPCLGGLLMKEEFTPVRLTAENAQVVSSHLSKEYTIPFSEIRSVSRFTVLPSGSRTNGTSMSSVDKGSFNLCGIGKCSVCLDPRCAPFLKITTTGGKVYLLGSAEAGEADAVFAALKNAGIEIKT